MLTNPRSERLLNLFQCSEENWEIFRDCVGVFPDKTVDECQLPSVGNWFHLMITVSVIGRQIKTLVAVLMILECFFFSFIFNFQTASFVSNFHR